MSRDTAIFRWPRVHYETRERRRRLVCRCGGMRRVYFSHRRNRTLCMQIRLNVVAASEWKWTLSLRAGREYIIMHSRCNSLKAMVIITRWARSIVHAFAHDRCDRPLAKVIGGVFSALTRSAGSSEPRRVNKYVRKEIAFYDRIYLGNSWDCK